MDAFSFQLESVPVRSRLASLFRLLGLVGLAALPFGGHVREATGRTDVSGYGGLHFIGQVEPWGTPGQASGYRIENGELHGSDGELYQLLDENIVLRTAPGPAGLVAQNSGLTRYRIVRVLDSVEAPAYPGGPAIAWKKLRGLDGSEGYAAASLSASLTKQTPLRIYVRSEDVRTVGPEYRYGVKGLALLPLRMLLAFNAVWLLHLPAALLFIPYQLASLILMLLNLLHACILERQHREFAQFLVRLTNYRLKLLVSILGPLAPVPHVDIHSREREKLPFRFAVLIDEPMKRGQAIGRLAFFAGVVGLVVGWPHFLGLLDGIARTVMLYASIGLGLLALSPILVYGIAQIALWATVASAARAPRILVDLEGRILRLGLTIELFLTGLTTSISVFKQSVSSPLVTRVSEPGKDRFDPTPGARVELNLVVLMLCIVLSLGTYSLCWLARTAKTLSDEPFTILLVTLMGGGLPLSFLFSRYYRRTELLQRSTPSILVEFLVMLPGINLLLGPFVVQYGLNAVARAQTKPE